MISKEQIKRINILYKKYKNNTITTIEEKERQSLRAQYIKSTKENLKSRLDSVKIQTPDGKIKKLKKRI